MADKTISTFLWHQILHWCHLGHERNMLRIVISPTDHRSLVKELAEMNRYFVGSKALLDHFEDVEIMISMQAESPLVLLLPSN